MLLALVVKKHWAAAVRANVNPSDLLTTPVIMAPELKSSNGRYVSVAETAGKRPVGESLEEGPVCSAFLINRGMSALFTNSPSATSIALPRAEIGN
jgi:hypothetical protein